MNHTALPSANIWEALYAEYEDLDVADPLRPAVIVHMPGAIGAACYNALHATYPTYVLGRGRLPDGRFVTSAQADYPALVTAVQPYWPAIPARCPRPPARRSRIRLLFTQELDDVNNYLAQPAVPDATIRAEAREGLRGLVPPHTLEPAVTACAWLVEHMQPHTNCFTLSALLTRWLHAHDVPASYCTGVLSYRAGEHVRQVAHAWVELGGRIFDLTVNAQGWGPLGLARLGVTQRLVHYEQEAARPGQSLVEFWRLFSRPTDRPTYTAASLIRQDGFLRRRLSSVLYQTRKEWVAAVRARGLLAGTLEYLLTVTG